MFASKADLAKLIDHSILKPNTSVIDIEKACKEAVEFRFHSVCINPFYIPLVRDLLSGSNIKITAVIGFPLGMSMTKVKVLEAIKAVKAGADELDIVMNIGMAKSGKWDIVKNDISGIISATSSAVHKIIIETCYLIADEKIKASEVVLEAGAEFIKTSTGFGLAGATVEDVRLIKAIVGNACGIKAAGGIKTLSMVKELIAAGATRIGTSSGVEIMKELCNAAL